MRYCYNRIFASVLMLALMTALILAGCSRKNRPVAKVGNTNITANEYREGFITRYRTQENAEKQSFKERKEFLDQLIERQLMVTAAYKKGLDKKEEVIKAADEAQERTAVNELLYAQEIVGKVITDSTARDYYGKLKEEIQARHILISAAAKDTASDSAAFAKIDSIHKIIAMEGGNFEEMARLFSDDKSNSSKGGDLGYFKWGRMVEEFQEAAFALKAGEVSEPVKTQFGWHLIQLVDRRPDTALKSFEAEKENIMNELKRVKGAELRETADDYLVKLKESLKLEYFDDSLEVVFKKIGDPSAPQNNSLFADFDEDSRKMVVAEWSEGKVTVADLDEKIGPGRPGMFNEAGDLKDVIDGILLPDLLARRAKELGLLKDPRALDMRKKSMENMMVREIEQLEVDDKLNYDDESLKMFFTKNQHRYMSEPEVSIREIFIGDKKKAEELLLMGKQGKDWKFLCSRYNEREESKKKDGLLGPFDKYRYGRIGREAHKLQEGQFNMSPIRMGNKYSIFRVEEKMPAKLKPFEEARDEVERDYKRDMRKEFRDKWLAALKEEIPVKINEKNLRAVLPFAQEEKPEPAKEEPAKPEKKVTLKKTEPPKPEQKPEKKAEEKK